MKMLLEDDLEATGCEIPTALTDEPASDILAFTLLRILRPDVSIEDAFKIMCRRRLKEDVIGQSYVEELGDEMVFDVVLAGDAKDLNLTLYLNKSIRTRRTRDLFA